MTRRGSKQVVAGRLYGRFWLGGEKRESVPLPGVSKDDDAAVAARCDVIADAAQRLVFVGHGDRARDFAVQLGAATTEKRLAAILKQVAHLVETARVVGAGITIKQLGQRWTSGDLAREYPDHVKRKATSKDDEQLLSAYVYPVVGSTAAKLFRLEDGERVMQRLPSGLSTARRRHVAQAMHRLLAIAVYPAKIIAVHPLPRNFLPKLGPPKAKQCLYPDEDAKLMACTGVGLAFRLFYGVVDREGFRFGEARTLAWSDLDLERGAVRLDDNKTDDPRSWALDPGVVAALRRWRAMRQDLAGPFAEIPNDEHQADRLREDLRLAGVDRVALFDRSAQSMPVRFHDLRATFVTVSLANGKTETWVSDRTGHKSSVMINRYKRAARTYAELRLGTLHPLDQAIVWDQDTECQNVVKRGRGSGGEPGSTITRKNKLGTEGGTRTLTPVRAADFESDAAPRGDAKQPKKGGSGSVRGHTKTRFDTVLTDLGELSRGWSAYETTLERMDPDGYARAFDGGGK
jgi:integrase